MKSKVFICPVCEHKIERKYSYCMNNFMTVKCSKCQSKLAPDLRIGMKIGAIGGLIGGLIGFGLPALGIAYGYVWFGLIAAFVFGAAFYIAVVNVTYKAMTFEKKE